MLSLKRQWKIGDNDLAVSIGLMSLIRRIKSLLGIPNHASIYSVFFLALFSNELAAFMIVSDVSGGVVAATESGVKLSVGMGSILDATYIRAIEGDGKLSVLCAADGSRKLIKSPGPVPSLCGKNQSFDKTYRSDVINDAPIIFFPDKDEVGHISSVVWGSESRGKFLIQMLEQAADGTFYEVYKSNEIKISTQQRKFITYEFDLPESVTLAMGEGKVYKIVVKNLLNGRTNEESNRAGGLFSFKPKTPKTYDESVFRDLNASSDMQIGLLTSGFYLNNYGAYYEGYSQIRKMDDGKYLAQKAFAKANILRRAGMPFDYYTSLYDISLQIAVRSSGDSTVARASCFSMQEDPFNLNEYWKNKIAQHKTSGRTAQYCN